MTTLPAIRQEAALAPQLSVDQLMQVAQVLIKSGLAPKGIKKPEDAVIVMLAGQELGLKPMQSLGHIYPVNGQPALGTKLMCALFLRKGHSYEIKEHTAERAVVLFRLKNGTPYEHTLTMKEAHAARWDQQWDYDKKAYEPKATWTNMPRVMLMYRCLSGGIRILDPSVLMGMATEDEALDQYPDPDMLDTLDAIDAAATVIEPSDNGSNTTPRWTDDAEMRGRFETTMKEIDLTIEQVLSALSLDCGKTVGRVSEYPKSYDDAILALRVYGKNRAPQPEGKLL